MIMIIIIHADVNFRYYYYYYYYIIFDNNRLQVCLIPLILLRDTYLANRFVVSS
jgi:hypothetical protein